MLVNMKNQAVFNYYFLLELLVVTAANISVTYKKAYIYIWNRTFMKRTRMIIFF